MSGMGNVFLGMNAHVNRDLPFVLESIGLVKPDGTSRKPDHDRVNDFLAATNQYLLPEAAKYLDPTLDDGDVPGTSRRQLRGRAGAGRRGGSRHGATPSASRRPRPRPSGPRWRTSIEQTAANEAMVIRASFRYQPSDVARPRCRRPQRVLHLPLLSGSPPPPIPPTPAGRGRLFPGWRRRSVPRPGRVCSVGSRGGVPLRPPAPLAPVARVRHLLVVLFVNLGFWQLRRHDEKVERNATVTRPGSSTPSSP